MLEQVGRGWKAHARPGFVGVRGFLRDTVEADEVQTLVQKKNTTE
jgi:hypothetical protein